MWSGEDRRRYDRRVLRDPSDLSDAEWALIEPHIPPAKRGGQRREVDMCKVLQGVLYLLETGCKWRHLPEGVPLRSTVWAHFDLWRRDGTLDRIHETLYAALREAEGRAPRPSAAIVDSQTVKSAEEGGANRRKRASTRAGRPGASSAMCSSTRLA